MTTQANYLVLNPITGMYQAGLSIYDLNNIASPVGTDQVTILLRGQSINGLNISSRNPLVSVIVTTATTYDNFSYTVNTNPLANINQFPNPNNVNIPLPLLVGVNQSLVISVRWLNIISVLNIFGIQVVYNYPYGPTQASPIVAVIASSIIGFFMIALIAYVFFKGWKNSRVIQ